MFTPEHVFLKNVGIPGTDVGRNNPEQIIGSNFVSGKGRLQPNTKSAIGFLKEVALQKRDRGGVYDDDVYYLPYLERYFVDLELAYTNVSLSLKPSFEGYIVVVNNTHRNLVIPVSDVILEIWKNLG
ncbi:MAG: hypothetical protein ABIP75_15675, partial [Pyrinomonadaceae bacterium]